MDVIISLLLILLETIAVIYIYQAFSKSKKGKLILYSFLNFIICLGLAANPIIASNYYLKIVIIILLYSLILGSAFEASVSKKISISIISVGIIYMIDYIVVAATVMIFKVDISEIFMLNYLKIGVSFFSKLLLVFISFIINRLIKIRKEEIKFTLLEWVQISIYPITSALTTIIIIDILMERSQTNVLFLMLVIGIIFANIIMFFIIDKINETKKIAIEHESLKQKSEMEMNTLKVLMTSYKDQRKLTHDFENHINVVSELATSCKYNELSEYINSIKTNTTLRLVVNTNNPILDALLNLKYNQAIEKGITIMFSISDLSSITVESEDLVVILGNAIDNAIDACSKLQGKEKLINVKIKKVDDKFIISIKNPISDILNKDLKTTKENKLNHGYGLKNIESVLKKYNSAPAIKIENGQFNLAILIDSD